MGSNAEMPFVIRFNDRVLTFVRSCICVPKKNCRFTKQTRVKTMGKSRMNRIILNDLIMTLYNQVILDQIVQLNFNLMVFNWCSMMDHPSGIVYWNIPGTKWWKHKGEDILLLVTPFPKSASRFILSSIQPFIRHIFKIRYYRIIKIGQYDKNRIQFIFR